MGEEVESMGELELELGIELELVCKLNLKCVMELKHQTGRKGS